MILLSDTAIRIFPPLIYVIDLDKIRNFYYKFSRGAKWLNKRALELFPASRRRNGRLQHSRINEVYKTKQTKGIVVQEWKTRICGEKKEHK